MNIDLYFFIYSRFDYTIPKKNYLFLNNFLLDPNKIFFLFSGVWDEGYLTMRFFFPHAKLIKFINSFHAIRTFSVLLFFLTFNLKQENSNVWDFDFSIFLTIRWFGVLVFISSNLWIKHRQYKALYNRFLSDKVQLMPIINLQSIYGFLYLFFTSKYSWKNTRMSICSKFHVHSLSRSWNTKVFQSFLLFLSFFDLLHF